MTERIIYNGHLLNPEEIAAIEKMTDNCPDLYFGNPEHPIPPVGCTKDCDVFGGECKRRPRRVSILAEVRVIERRIKTGIPKPEGSQGK